MIDFSKFKFAPVIKLPTNYEVYDFTKGYDPKRERSHEYGIGKYNEKRRGMYEQEIFSDRFSNRRDIHMGIDIAAPVGTPVHAFYDGEIFLFQYNSAAGDYGYTLITHHVIDGVSLYALFGHLSAKSIANKNTGAKIRAGDVIAWLGDETENGGWNPHLHFQLSYEQPKVCDMPGVVSDDQRAAALKTYPDPRLVLGPLY